MSKYFFPAPLNGLVLEAGTYTLSFWCKLVTSAPPINILYNICQSDDTQGNRNVLIVRGSNTNSTPIINQGTNLISYSVTLPNRYTIASGKYLNIEVRGYAPTSGSNTVRLFTGGQYRTTFKLETAN
jgi:hypothetical protein